MIIEVGNLTHDLEVMNRIHETHENEFMPIVQRLFPHAKFFQVPDGRQLIYVDNGKSILGVAHLDGTMKAKPSVYQYHFMDNRHRLFSPFVDDRSGAYALLHLLPQVDIECDLLFTVGEETGQTTGEYFTSNRQYNWMFQFDRGGIDVVHYQYTAPEWIILLRQYFLSVTHGAFSDISFMGHMGCQAMNIGTGYYSYTTNNANLDIGDLSEQVHRFKPFYDDHKDTFFPHTASARGRWEGWNYPAYEFTPDRKKKNRK